MELDPPHPTQAKLYGFPTKIVVTFNHQLVPGPLNSSIWFARWNGTWYTMTGASASGKDVTLAYTAGPPNPGPNVVNWTPPPYDVKSAGGNVPAAPILDFPLS